MKLATSSAPGPRPSCGAGRPGPRLPPLPFRSLLSRPGLPLGSIVENLLLPFDLSPQDAPLFLLPAFDLGWGLLGPWSAALALVLLLQAAALLLLPWASTSSGVKANRVVRAGKPPAGAGRGGAGGWLFPPRRVESSTRPAGVRASWLSLC